ncbi:hypothetical protein [Roseibium sp.]|uniref:hypothetical protein n=1 Tax=Roseibium sp. TaxID=1936156 RepID=UPI003B51D4EE
MPAQAITDTRQAKELCDSLDIVCLPGNVPIRTSPTSGAQTNAEVTIQKMINLHGEQHAWAVLYALTQSENHLCDLTSAMIGAISDLFLGFPTWRERLGEFCDALDRMDLSGLRAMAKKGPGIDGSSPKQRVLLAGYLQVLLWDLMEMDAQKELVA